jgi:TRAP transporter TAXI family solute receptor
VQKREAAVPVKQQFVNIVTGRREGVDYTLGGILAGALNKDIPGVNASVQTADSAVSGIRLLASGKADIAFVENDIAFYALNGMGAFKNNRVYNVKALTALYEKTLFILTPENSGIKALADIKGGLVAAGIDVFVNMPALLAEFGLTEKNVKFQPLAYHNEAIAALASGKADVAFVFADEQDKQLRELVLREKISFLSIEENKTRALLLKYPFYERQSLPAGSYNGQAKAVNTLKVNVLLVANDKVDDELAYKILKVLYSNLPKLREGY